MKTILTAIVALSAVSAFATTAPKTKAPAAAPVSCEGVTEAKAKEKCLADAKAATPATATAPAATPATKTH